MKEKRKRHYYVLISVVVFIILVATGLFYISVAYDYPFISLISGNILRGRNNKEEKKLPKNTGKTNTFTNNYTDNLELRFIDAYMENKEKDDTIKISPSGKNLIFSVNFIDEKVKTIKFRIKNTGSKKALLNGILEDNPGSLTGISILWPNLDKVVLDVGQTSGEYSIVIAWDGTGTRKAGNVRAGFDYLEYIE